MREEEYDGHSPDGAEVAGAVGDIVLSAFQLLHAVFFLFPYAIYRSIRDRP
jgi:hypothetical protein